MRLAPVHHRPPRAGVDPIDSADAAFLAISVAVTRPLRHETVVLLLDDERRGIAVVVVSGTVDPDAVVDVVELLTDPFAHDGRVGSIVVGTVRPGASVDERGDGGRDREERGAGGRDRIDESDVDRWLEMSELADQAGIELLEWFVIGGDVAVPRELLGEPPRW